MPEALELKGQGASPGVARGPAHPVAAAGTRLPRPATDPAAEAEALRAAIADAVAALRALVEKSDLESAAIMEFQVEMLLDPMMTEPVLARIRGGLDAASSWTLALDDYIAGFAGAEDEPVRARAADLLDIRDRVLAALSGEEWPDFPAGSVFVGPDIAPSHFLTHDWSRGGGIVLFDGSAASHVAMLARSRAVPMVVGTGAAPIAPGTPVVVDGAEGRVRVGSDLVFVPETEEAVGFPAVNRTADGVTVGVFANVNHPSELATLDPARVDGIGLLRSEFLIARRSDLLDEERQCAAYRTALAWAKGRPVTIRLLDFGGDKPLPGETGTSSPLGSRGVRLLLSRPEMLRTQVRALLRASADGDLRIMLSMVTVPEEVDAVRVVVVKEAAALAVAVPPVGMMVEVPAAALTLERFANADFFSFGTNDRAQFLAAAARDDAAVAGLHEAAAPAVTALVKLALEKIGDGRPVSICGDMAGEPRHLPGLLSAGLRAFSMAPARLAAFRARLAGLTVGEG